MRTLVLWAGIATRVIDEEAIRYYFSFGEYYGERLDDDGDGKRASHSAEGRAGGGKEFDRATE